MLWAYRDDWTFTTHASWQLLGGTTRARQVPLRHLRDIIIRYLTIQIAASSYNVSLSMVQATQRFRPPFNFAGKLFSYHRRSSSQVSQFPIARI